MSWNYNHFLQLISNPLHSRFSLIDMIDNWLNLLDTQSHYLRVCFIDFKKAFDRIDHNTLVSKLLTLGVRRSIIPWIFSWPTKRKQSLD